MKTLLVTLMVLVLGAGLGMAIHQDPGYVLVVYQHWSIETSLWVAGFAWLVLWGVIALFWQCLTRAYRVPGQWRLWEVERRQYQLQKLTQDGFCAFFEGDWQKALVLLGKGAYKKKLPLINYLAAARAAFELKDYSQSEALLKQAASSTQGTGIAVGLTQAQCQIGARQWERALATLCRLETLKPHHPYILKLLNLVYLELNDWRQSLALLPRLKKFKVLSEKDYQKMEKRIWMQHLGQDDSLLPWNTIPKSLRDDADLILLYTKQQIKAGDLQQALSFIQSTLNRIWMPPLLNCILDLSIEDWQPLLVFGESLLKKHPKDAHLLFFLGKLCERLHCLKKAKNYLQLSLEIYPQPSVYVALASIYERQGNSQKALQYYRLVIKR